MADFSALKQSIQNYIKQNGNKEITGNLLQTILLSMVTTMGDGAINDNASDISDIQNEIQNITGALYAGYATPSTTPATLTSQDVFYLATQAGTYTNFHFNGGDDPIVLTKDGIYFIVSGDDDDDWNAEPMLQLDDVPTAGSDNPVKSGGVAEELALGAVYDVSAKNPTAGHNNDGKWESLSALLSDANLNTLIPTSVRKGGMSVKFVSSVDNKYVQYRLMAQTFSTDVTQWQSVDNKLTALSKNLIIDRAVEDEISKIYDLNGNLVIRNSLSGTKQDGYIFNYSTKQYDHFGNNVCVITITSDFTVGERYLFVGQNFSVSNYKTVYFLDSSDNILEYYYDAENITSSFIHLLTVPEGTAKIIINGYQGNAEMVSFDIDKNYNLKMAKEQLNSNVFKIAGSGLYNEDGYNRITSYQIFYGEPIEVIEGNSLFIQSNDSFHITYYSSKSEFTSQTAISHIAVASGYDNYVGMVPVGAKVAIISISSNKEIRVTNTNKIINNDCLIPVTQLRDRDAGLEYSFNSKYDTVKNTENVGASPFAPVIFDEGKYIFASNNDFKLLGYINRGIGIEDVFITINTNTNIKRLTLFIWPYNGSLTYENYSLTFSEEPSSSFLLYKTEYDSTNNNIIVTGIDTTGTKIRAIAYVAGANETQTKYLQELCKNCIKCNGFVVYTGNGFISYGVYDTLGAGWSKYKDNNVAKWYGKKGVTFGDSLTAQGYYVGPLRNNFGMTIENCAVSGTEYTRKINDPNKPPIYTQIANSTTTNPDFVFIMGGTNDYSDQKEIGTYTDVTDSTVCGGCYLAFTAIRQKWPLVPVFVGLVPVRDTSSVYPALPGGIDGRDANHTLKKYNDAIEVMAKRFGFNVIDSMECGIGPGNMDTYYQDGIHFNTAGGIRFAQFIVDKMDVITPH